MTVKRVYSAICTILRIGVIYEFTRSVVAGAARQHHYPNGALVLIDGFALVVASILEPEETRWPYVIGAFLATEATRYLLTTPHLFR